MFLSTEQNAGQNVSQQNDSFSGMHQFKYMGTTRTNCQWIHEEIKSRLNSSECLVVCGAVSFVLQFPVQKYEG